jgi:hypothetical protein
MTAAEWRKQLELGDVPSGLLEDFEAAELIVKRMEEWAFVAFYPGPNENPHFQAGYMEAVGEAGAVLSRLQREAAALRPVERAEDAAREGGGQ